jgi:hypothetical protein
MQVEPKREPAYKGFLDVANCNVIMGWVADGYRRDISIRVRIYADKKLIADLLANGERPDVGDTLGDNGLHGFILATPHSLKDGKPHVIDVEFEASGQYAHHSGMQIRCEG